MNLSRRWLESLLGRSLDAQEIAALLGKVGRCDVTNNIYGAKWTKLIANTMTPT